MRRAGLAAIATVAAAACGGNERADKARQLIEFAASIPYDLRAAEREYSGFRIAVADSAIEHYNRVFALFASPESTRASDYRELPGMLLQMLPATAIHEEVPLSFGDTASESFVISRPPIEQFEKDLASATRAPRGAEPAEEKRRAFSVLLERARRELQVLDTVTVFFDSAGAITRFRTTSDVRRWLAMRAQLEVRERQLKEVVRSARLVDMKIVDLAQFGAAIFDISGSIELTSAQMPDSADPVSIRTECDAIGAATTFAGAGWVSSALDRRLRPMFDCHWPDVEISHWRRARPTRFRVRLVARDSSVVGSWFTFP